MDGLKPKWPSCEGRQYARNPYGDNYLDVHYDEATNERAEDKPEHTDATPGHSNPLYSGRQYAKDFRSYGEEKDAGGVSRESASVNVHEAERGKES